jgi:hypothetical protein
VIHQDRRRRAGPKRSADPAAEPLNELAWLHGRWQILKNVTL